MGTVLAPGCDKVGARSNLDVWALSACHFLLFLVLVAISAGREAPRNLAVRSRRYFRLSFANTLLLGVCEVCSRLLLPGWPASRVRGGIM